MTDISKPLRILFVTPISPFSASSGAEQRSALMLSALQSLAKVDVLQLKHGKTTQVEVVEGKGKDNGCVIAQVSGADLSFRRYQPKPQLTQLVERALQCEMSGYDLIVGRYVWPVCQLFIPDTTPVIADLDDFKYRCAKEAPVTWASLKTRAEKALAAFFARQQLNRFKAVFFVSTLDQREAPHLISAVLPNVPYFSSDLREAIPGSSNVLFVGSLWYRPNAEAVDWLLRQIWPSVVRQVPSATLSVVGAASSITRERWQANPGVFAPGFVEDLGQAYANAALVVVPLLSGGGSNIKVLEALAHRRPCLVTRFCHGAFENELVAGSDLLVASNAKDFVRLMVESLRDPDRCAALAIQGHATVTSSFNADAFKATVVSMAHRALKLPIP